MKLKEPLVKEVFFEVEDSSKVYLSYYEEGVQAGFPSPATDYQDKKLDLNELLIKNKESTFFVKARGDSMIDAGISNGDILVVDRSRQCHNGDIVIAVVDGLFTVKFFHKAGEIVKLVPGNKKYEEMVFSKEQVLMLWGVVTSIVKVL